MAPLVGPFRPLYWLLVNKAVAFEQIPVYNMHASFVWQFQWTASCSIARSERVASWRWHPIGKGRWAKLPAGFVHFFFTTRSYRTPVYTH